MDWVGIAAGVLIALAAVQLYREWDETEPTQRLGNLLLIAGVALAVLGPGVVDRLGIDPRFGMGLRLAGFLFVLGAAYVILT